MKTIFTYNTNKLQKGRGVVIYGCFECARKFALRLIRQNIKFDYFSYISNKAYTLSYLMNKKVLSVKDLKELDDYIIIVPWQETECAKKQLKKYGLEDRLCNIEEICLGLTNTSNLIIYGTGVRADSLFRDIGKCLNVNSFCDSNEEKIGRPFNDKPVMHISELLQAPLDTCVIIGSSFYYEIREKLLQVGLKEDQIYYEGYGLDCFPDEKHRFFYNLPSFLEIIYDCNNKNVILYGEKNMVRMMGNAFSHFNIEVEKLERNGFEEDGTIFSLAYHDEENTILIILDNYSVDTQSLLDSIGLKSLQCVWLEDYTSFHAEAAEQQRHCVLDPHLGFALQGSGEEGYNGFIKYSYINNVNKPLVIVTLGGSTTTGYGVRAKPWPECLSELLAAHGEPHIIYNGGISGYTVSQELLKLIRDGIRINPDYVISYSGVNNALPESLNDLDFNTPFVHYFQREFYDNVINYATAFSPLGKSNAWKISSVSYGIEKKYDKFEFWYTQLKMMHAVCDEFAIKYEAFLQPMLYNKANIKNRDRELLFRYGFLCLQNFPEAVGADERQKIFGENALHFRHSARDIDEPWFHDLSDLFDEYDGLYMDNCHVYEKGNRIIAQRIYDIVFDSGKEEEE